MTKSLQCKVEKQTQTEIAFHVYCEDHSFGMRVFAHKDRAGNILFNIQETNGEAGVPTSLVITKLVGDNKEIKGIVDGD